MIIKKHSLKIQMSIFLISIQFTITIIFINVLNINIKILFCWSWHLFKLFSWNSHIHIINMLDPNMLTQWVLTCISLHTSLKTTHKSSLDILSTFPYSLIDHTSIHQSHFFSFSFINRLFKYDQLATKNWGLFTKLQNLISLLTDRNQLLKSQWIDILKYIISTFSLYILKRLNQLILLIPKTKKPTIVAQMIS